MEGFDFPLKEVKLNSPSGPFESHYTERTQFLLTQRHLPPFTITSSHLCLSLTRFHFLFPSSHLLCAQVSLCSYCLFCCTLKHCASSWVQIPDTRVCVITMKLIVLCTAVFFTLSLSLRFSLLLWLVRLQQSRFSLMCVSVCVFARNVGGG